MIKSFLKDALVYTLPAILSRGIAIFLLPIYTRIATANELGVLDLFLMFGNMVLLTVSLEIAQAIARFIPEISERKIKNIYNSTGLLFTLFTYSFFWVFSLNYINEISSLITNDRMYSDYFLISLLCIYVNGFFYYFQNLLRFEGDSKGYSLVAIVYASSNLGLAYLLGVVFKIEFFAILYASLISVFLSTILAYILLRNCFCLKIDFSVLKKLLFFSVPLVPSSVLVFVSLYIDRYMISLMIGVDEVGKYGVAVRLASAASLIMIGFQMAITPLVFKYHNEPDTPRNLSVIFRYFVVVSTLFFLIYSFSVKEILILFVTPEYYSIYAIIPVLVLAFLFSNMYVFMPGIAIKKKTYLFFMINAFAAIINVVLNYFFIPFIGAEGAALATAIGYFFAFLAYVLLSQQFYYVEHAWIKYIVLLILSILIVFLYYYCVDLSFYTMIIIRFLLLFLFVFIVFKLKVITVSEFKVILASVSKKI